MRDVSVFISLCICGNQLKLFIEQSKIRDVRTNKNGNIELIEHQKWCVFPTNMGIQQRHSREPSHELQDRYKV